MTTTPSNTAQNLRQRAEELFRTNEYFIPELTSPEETKLLFYELRVDQIQLEIQNEELRAVSAIYESEDRFKNMANTTPVLIWLSGTDKLCYWFNQAWLDFTGRTMAQEAGNGWTEGVHPDDLERCLATYIKAFDNRQPFSMEYRLRAADGQYRWLIDNGVPTYAENAFTGYIGSCVDITGQKIVEKELSETTALLTNITNSNPDAIYSKDLDGRYILFNNAAASFVGKSADEVLGNNDYNLFPPDVAEKLMKKDHESVKEGTVVTFEETVTNLSGLEISFLVTKGPLINQEGEVFGVFGVSRDITERKQTERELTVLRELSLQMAEKRTEEIRKSERFTNDIIDSMISHIAVLDATGKIIKINKPWKRFAEENCGHNYISDFVGTNYLTVCRASIDSDNGQDAAAACEGLSSVLQRETEHFLMEYSCHSPVEQRWFLMTVSRLNDSQGIVVSHTDITKCKQAEEREKETKQKPARQKAELP
ncbi:MAG: PAS domain S-box protein [Desulfuromonadaceae bacterium]